MVSFVHSLNVRAQYSLSIPLKISIELTRRYSMGIKLRSLTLLLLGIMFFAMNQDGIAVGVDISQTATSEVRSTKPLPRHVINLSSAMQVSQLTVLKGRDSWIEDLAIDPHRQLLAVAEYSGEVEIWDMRTWKERALVPLDLQGDITSSVVFSPDGQTLVIASGSNIFLRDVDDILNNETSPRTVVLEGHKGYAGGLAVSTDGKYLASSEQGSASEDGMIILWDLLRSREVTRLGTKRCYTAPTVAFSPDNTKLASTTCDGFVRIWDRLLSKELISFEGNTPVEFNSAGTLLGFAGTDSTVRLIDVKTGREITVLKSDIFSPADAVTSIAFNPDGTILAAGTSGLGGIVLWNVATGKALTILRAGGVTRLIFSPDGSLLISGHASAAGAFADTNVWGIK
jgi:WD40 repeat protein